MYLSFAIARVFYGHDWVIFFICSCCCCCSSSIPFRLLLLFLLVYSSPFIYSAVCNSFLALSPCSVVFGVRCGQIVCVFRWRRNGDIPASKNILPGPRSHPLTFSIESFRFGWFLAHTPPILLSPIDFSFNDSVSVHIVVAFDIITMRAVSM